MTLKKEEGRKNGLGFKPQPTSTPSKRWDIKLKIKR